MRLVVFVGLMSIAIGVGYEVKDDAVPFLGLLLWWAAAGDVLEVVLRCRS